MALIPIDQYKKGSATVKKSSRLKFLPPKAVQPARVAQRPDIRQSENYKKSVTNADRMAQEAQKASSFRGMARNTFTGIPQAVRDIKNQPIKDTLRSAGAGVYEGGLKPLLKAATYVQPSMYQNGKGRMSREFLDVIGNKIAPKNQNAIQEGVRGGFKFAGAVAPYEAGAGLANAAIKSKNLAGLAGYVGGGQLAYEGENNVKDRGKQALMDSLLFGLTKVAGKGLGKLKTAGQAAPYAVPNVLPSTRVSSHTDLAPLPPKSPQSVSLATGKTAPLSQRTALMQGMGGAKEISQTVSLSSNPKGDRLPSRQVPLESKVPKVSQSVSYTSNSTLVPETQTLTTAANNIINPLKPKVKERGFVETVRNSPEISQDLAKRVDATYDVRHNKAAQEKAQRLIFDNVNEAERIATGGMNDDAVFTASELVKHYDSIAQKAKQTGNVADFEFAMSKAVDVAQKSAANLTEAGRTVQAASTINRLSPDGIIQYVNKAVKEVGKKDIKISNEKYYEIVRKAGEVNKILNPKQKALKTFELLDDIYSDIPKSMQYKVSEILNLPRAIMSTADLSAPLRQGIFTMARHPVTFAKDFGKMFKYAFSENAYRNLKADILTSPNYSLYVKHKLPLTDISQGLVGREEQFMSSLSEKIPGFGTLAKGSNRAYSGFLNKLRVDLFDDFVKTAKLSGIKDPKYFDDAARFVGSATGRGDIAKLFGGNKSGPIWNSFFFSPRLMSSRLSLINPVYYTKLHPAVRKEAIKSLAAFVSTGSGILALAKLNGAEVSTDPRSADFGKIKIGNTRYDTWGGFQQYARLIGQLVTGEKISTTTGKETQLGSGGYNAPTHESIVMDFLKSKANPVTSFIIRASQGEQYGEKFNLPAEVIGRFLPMVSNDIYNLTKEYGPKGAAMAIPGFFGVGSMTYGDQIPMMSETESGNPTMKWRGQPELGEAIWNKVAGVELSDIPKEQWKALEEERLNEQKRNVEVNKAKSLVLISGEPQYVGDTKVYLENGVVKTKKESKDKRLPLKDQIIYEELQKRKSQPFYTP